DGDVQGVSVSRISIRVYNGEPEPDLTESERESLFEDGIHIRDDRDEEEVSKAIPEKFPLALFPPMTAGVYPTLLSKGLTDTIVVPHPHGANYRSPGTLVIDKDSKKWSILPDEKVLVKDCGRSEEHTSELQS